jgi:hypothetical protein
MRPTSLEEVEFIVKYMASRKSPRPNGFTMIFLGKLVDPRMGILESGQGVSHLPDPSYKPSMPLSSL